MDSLFLLIPAAVIFSSLGIWLLLWAINSGQYDDLDKEAWRVLVDDEAAEISTPPSTKSNESA